jgi:hypothetical protein
MDQDSGQSSAKHRYQERVREKAERRRREQEQAEQHFVEDYEKVGAAEQYTNRHYADVPMVPSPPLEWGDEPDFALPGKWMDMTSISPKMMSRHWMVMGETGSGKTKSVILPLLNSLLEYELETADKAQKEVAHG